MSDRNSSSDTELLFAIGSGLAIFILYYYDEIITYPWAMWRYVDSLIWSKLFFFLPDFITVPHTQIIDALDGLDSWVLLDYKHIYRVEYSVIYITTWLYLLPTTFAIKRIVKKQRHFDKYKKRLNMDMLIEQETPLWRYNRYLVNNNPIEDSLDVNKGVFACRDTVRAGLIRTESLKVNRATNSVTMDYQRANDVFSKQLKHPINRLGDVNNLPLHFRFLICVFALREESLEDVITSEDIVHAKRTVSFLKLKKMILPKMFHSKINQQIMHLGFCNYQETQRIPHELGINEDLRFQLLGDYSYHLNGELDLIYVEKLVNKVLPIVMKNKIIISLFEQHAYAETFIRRLLRESRSLGKLSPSQFSFIKIIDRELWYACNDEGLPGCSFEAAGVKAHFEEEYSKERRHIFPSVEQAFTDLDSMNLPKTADEYDTIVVEIPKEHPYSKLYPYDASIEYQEHLEKLRTDPEYKLQQTLIRR